MPFAAATVYWHFPVLLVTFSLVYAATRHDRWDRILWEAAGWVLRMGGFLGMLGLLLYVFSTYPKYAPYLATVLGVGMAVYYLVSSPWFRKKRPDQPVAAGSGK